jgi:hypothetical protein
MLEWKRDKKQQRREQLTRSVAYVREGEWKWGGKHEREGPFYCVLNIHDPFRIAFDAVHTAYMGEYR